MPGQGMIRSWDRWWKAWMLWLAGEQVEWLLDQLLPVEVRELPADLAVGDRLLADARLLVPIERVWEHNVRGHGRPTIPMACLVRLLVVKQRTGRGYQTLVREVSDGLHLRRLCLLPLTQQVPDESTVRKLVRRLGPEVVAELTRVVIGKAQRATRFRARAVRIDATVVASDIRDPLGWGAGLAGRAGAGPTGPQAGRSAARPDLAGGGSVAADRRGGAGDLQDAGQAHRRGVGAQRHGRSGVGWFDPAGAGAGRPGHAPRRVGVAPGPSWVRLASWMTTLTAASGSSPSSSSGSVGRRSLTGWCG
jgi:Transposase domain (DUF772)